MLGLMMMLILLLLLGQKQGQGQGQQRLMGGGEAWRQSSKRKKRRAGEGGKQ